jgi:trigger factor
VGAQPYINQKDAQFEVIKESDFPMKGFAEELMGLKKEETKEFKLSFPQDYGRPELAGKEASFKILVKEIKQEKLTEINDDFAKLVNPDFKTVEDLRNKVIESLKKAAEEKAKRDFQQKVIEEVVNKSEVEFPPVMVEEEIDNLIRQEMRRWQLDEKGMDEYLSSLKKTPEQLRDELRPMAMRGVKQSLVLTEVARNEKIQIEEADFNNELENMVKNTPTEKKEQLVKLLSAPQAQANLASAIVTRKTVEKLEEIAKSPAVTGEKTENAEASKAEAPEKEAKE